eukprot:766561-Hanusia_phi.AAC.2
MNSKPEEEDGLTTSAGNDRLGKMNEVDTTKREQYTEGMGTGKEVEREEGRRDFTCQVGAKHQVRCLKLD